MTFTPADSKLNLQRYVPTWRQWKEQTTRAEKALAVVVPLVTIAVPLVLWLVSRSVLLTVLVSVAVLLLVWVIVFVRVALLLRRGGYSRSGYWDGEKYVRMEGRK